MKVSIVIPTYRREEELRRALESLAAQTLTDIEAVVVDDNDCPEWNGKVEAVIDAFRAEYPDFALTYIQNHPGLGSAEARNAGIDAAEGEYITFLDDDDEYMPEKVERQYDFTLKGGYDYTVTDLELYYEDGELCERRRRDYLADPGERTLLCCHLMYHITGTDTIMFRAEYLRGIGCFAPIDMGDEFYLMLRAITGEGKFGYLPECHVKAYVHRGEGGLSSGPAKIDGENSLFEYKKQYFNSLSKRYVRFIKMRHHAVLSFALLRSGHLFGFVGQAILAFACAPVQSVRMYMKLR